LFFGFTNRNLKPRFIFQRASRPKKKGVRKTAIKGACNKWLIFWMGNTSKELE
ncbi:unnamed protein product, partial [Heterotrigona itama]